MRPDGLPFLNLSWFSHNPHYELHSTADEPLAETPPEEAAETPTAPLVEEEGKLGEEMTRSFEIFLLHLVGKKMAG